MRTLPSCSIRSRSSDWGIVRFESVSWAKVVEEGTLLHNMFAVIVTQDHALVPIPRSAGMHWIWRPFPMHIELGYWELLPLFLCRLLQSGFLSLSGRGRRLLGHLLLGDLRLGALRLHRHGCQWAMKNKDAMLRNREEGEDKKTSEHANEEQTNSRRRAEPGMT